jgi:hypothetical protein
MAPLSRIAAQLLFLSYIMEVLNSRATADKSHSSFQQYSTIAV